MKKVVFRLSDDIDNNMLADIIKAGLPKDNAIAAYSSFPNRGQINAMRRTDNKTDTYEIWKVK